MIGMCVNKHTCVRGNMHKRTHKHTQSFKRNTGNCSEDVSPYLPEKDGS